MTETRSNGVAQVAYDFLGGKYQLTLEELQQLLAECRQAMADTNDPQERQELWDAIGKVMKMINGLVPARSKLH